MTNAQYSDSQLNDVQEPHPLPACEELALMYLTRRENAILLFLGYA